MQTFSKFPVNLTILETTSLQKPGNFFGLSNSTVNRLSPPLSIPNRLPDCHKVDKTFTVELKNLLKIINLHLQLIWESVQREKKSERQHMRFNSDYKVTRRQCPTEKTISPLRGFSHYCGATESIISSYYSLQQETFLLLPSPLQKTTYKKHPLPARPEEESSNPIN